MYFKFWWWNKVNTHFGDEAGNFSDYYTCGSNWVLILYLASEGSIAINFAKTESDHVNLIVIISLWGHSPKNIHRTKAESELVIIIACIIESKLIAKTCQIAPIFCQCVPFWINRVCKCEKLPSHYFLISTDQQLAVLLTANQNGVLYNL